MYLSWEQRTITDFADTAVEAMYGQGFVFTRLGRGEMSMTRSVRIDLSRFELSSENRRILRKIDGVIMCDYPLPYDNYSWRIHKLGAHFYTTKFGNNIFSANKIKQLMTEPDKSSFNHVLVYTHNEADLGYTVVYETPNIIHYSYPFYDLAFAPKEMGIGMMLTAITSAKESGKKYVYLGSARRPEDTYKLQFSGVEWFNGTNWSNNTNELKELLRN